LVVVVVGGGGGSSASENKVDGCGGGVEV